MTLDTKGKYNFMSCVAKAWDIGEGLFVFAWLKENIFLESHKSRDVVLTHFLFLYYWESCAY